MMSHIRGKNTGPEIMVRKFLFSHGYRFRIHDKKLPGKPDIVLKKYKTIIEVRGCFWHGHKNCKFGDRVKTDSIEVAGKVQSAKIRDSINEKKWKQLGWNFIVVWDSCELEIKKKKSINRETILLKLLKTLENNKNSIN